MSVSPIECHPHFCKSIWMKRNTCGKCLTFNAMLVLLAFPINRHWNNTKKIFFEVAIHGLFFIYFSLFKQTLQQIYGIKCPSSIQCWDSYPWPLEYESPPMTTRPGPPPKKIFYYSRKMSSNIHLGTSVTKRTIGITL